MQALSFVIYHHITHLNSCFTGPATHACAIAKRYIMRKHHTTLATEAAARAVRARARARARANLYTNIPQHEGTQACLDAIEAANASDLDRDSLQALFDIVLVGNLFRFDSQVYSQLVGTAMGTKMAPSYANLFMDRFERGFLDSEPTRPLAWLDI